MSEVKTSWRPPEQLPTLNGVKELALDTETTGLSLWLDKPVGLSAYTADGRCYYLPWAHKGGGNLDEGLIKRWVQRELRGKKLYFLNADFDINMLFNWGVNLEEQGNSVHDIGFWAALIDDNRRYYSLDALATDFLHEKKKELPFHASQIADHAAGEVGPYAEHDVRLTWELRKHFEPLMVADELEQVRDLEDKLIFVSVEMERNGVRLDLDRLHKWGKIVHKRYKQRVLYVYKETGMRINPNSFSDLKRLFLHLKISYPRTAAGASSFTEVFLKTIDHPVVQAALETRQLLGILSRYLEKYANEVGKDGILRYHLHQMRRSGGGTVTGRYSSSNINVQQVFKEGRQDLCVKDLVIRDLFLPAVGRTWCCSDASQIEFRLFAHYSRSERLIAAYRDNPNTDFHEKVAKLTSLDRGPAKNLNFAKLFGAQRKKFAEMIGRPREETDPLFDKYDEDFPEARRLMNQAQYIAGKRGYVKTLLGRRRRFPTRERLYSALNAFIQGSAADIMKLKLLEVYAERKRLGLTMRFPVHDELNCDLESPERAVELGRLLDRDALPLSVPIRWNVSTGESWGASQRN